VKTNAQWSASGKCLEEFLEVGDLVDDELRMYFIEVLPPACMSRRCIQIGEPVRHDPSTGEPMFETLLRVVEGWKYAGVCVTPNGEVCQHG
jgi:hypothetical protein